MTDAVDGFHRLLVSLIILHPKSQKVESLGAVDFQIPRTDGESWGACGDEGNTGDSLARVCRMKKVAVSWAPFLNLLRTKGLRGPVLHFLDESRVLLLLLLVRPEPMQDALVP